MKALRLIFAAALISLAVAACSSPTVSYPQPNDEEGKQDPPPAPGLTIGI